MVLKETVYTSITVFNKTYFNKTVVTDQNQRGRLMGLTREGDGGLKEQFSYQGLGPKDIQEKIMTLAPTEKD